MSFADLYNKWTEAGHVWISDTFGPILKPFFHSLDSVFDNIYMPWARLSADALFIGAILWVYSLKKEYVNLDAPSKAWYADLRIWTVVCLLPHIFVYLFL